MFVDAAEFRSDLTKYLELVQYQDIIIMDHGEFVARVSGAGKEKRRILDEISGSVAFDGDPEEIFAKRLDDM